MKNLFTLSLSMLFFTLLFAQKRTKKNDTTHHVTVIYDFLSKSDPLKILRWNSKKNGTDTLWDVCKLYYGDKINFKIKVNPFLYDVKVNGTDVFDDARFDTTGQSTLLNFLNLKTGSSSTGSTKITPSTTVANSEIPVATTDPIKTQAGKTTEVNRIAFGLLSDAPELKIEGAIKEAKKRYNENIEQAVAVALDTSVSFIQSQQSIALKDAAQSRYIRFLSELKGHELVIDQYIQDYEDEKEKLQNILVMSLADYKDYGQIKEEINKYLIYAYPKDSFQVYHTDSAVLPDGTVIPEVTTSNARDTVQITIELLKNSIDYVLRYYSRSIRSELIRAENAFVQMKIINKLYNIQTYSFDSTIYAGNKVRASTIINENLGEFTRAYMVFLQNLDNSSLFEKTYFPCFATADSFRFQVSLIPSIRASSLLSAYKITVRDTSMKPYTLPVKRYLKLNFSTGFSFLFGGAVPHTYFFNIPKDQLTDTDTLFIKKGRRTAALVPRIALYSHIYLTNGNWSMPALTFGISTNPADPSETAYMMGGSLIMGHHRRMVVTIGAALANIDQAKARYQKEIDVPHQKKFFQNIDESGLLEKRLALGAFFGVSYRF